MSRRHATAALGLAAVSASQARDCDQGNGRVDSWIQCGPLLVVGGIGGWYPNRCPDGPGDVRQQKANALTTMKEGRGRAARWPMFSRCGYRT